MQPQTESVNAWEEEGGWENAKSKSIAWKIKEKTLEGK